MGAMDGKRCHKVEGIGREGGERVVNGKGEEVGGEFF